MKRLAINGFGRIGRCVLRALNERPNEFDFEVVAINEPANLATIAHLLKYDSTHGRFSGEVDVGDDCLLLRSRAPVGDDLFNTQTIAVSHHQAIDALPWAELEIDLVLECSGQFNSREAAAKHLEQGAKKVLISHPASTDVDNTVVMGVNDDTLHGLQRVISNASCTTNCILPIIDVLDRSFSIVAGHITTLHSMMNDQPVIDAYHNTDLRKTRGASQSMIPIDTELARGISRIKPEMEGRFMANAVRVPVSNVSAMDLVVSVKRGTTASEVNAVLQEAADSDLHDIISCCNDPLASCDFNHDPHSAIIDVAQTSVSGGNLVKIFSWFDNEWGFANRMLEVSHRLLN